LIDFEAVVRHFGEEAVRLQLQEAETLDNPALTSLRSKNAPGRVEILRRWFYNYQVFQGISADKRAAVASAVLQWADARDLQSNLSTLEAVEQAHTELMAACSNADGRSRDFTSLASKALWLCYPYDVPIFDSFAQRALWVIAKLEAGCGAAIVEGPEYRRFLHVWKSLYDRYAVALSQIDAHGYLYRVRILDKILWMIGTRDYVYRT
jgi:hypothetical protein